MSKAILVMDMPKSCKDCRIRFSDSWSNYCPCEKTGTYYEDVDEFVQHNSKPNWCPLKEVLIGTYDGKELNNANEYKEYIEAIDIVEEGGIK